MFLGVAAVTSGLSVGTFLSGSRRGSLLHLLATNSMSSKGSALVKHLLFSDGGLCRSRLSTLRHSDGQLNGTNRRVSCTLLLSNLGTRHRRNVAVSITCHCFSAGGHGFVVTSAPKRRRCAHGVVANNSATGLTVVLMSTHVKMVARAEHRAFLMSLLKVGRMILTIGGVSLMSFSRRHFGRVMTRCGGFMTPLKVPSIAYVPLSTLSKSGIISGSREAP